jgi:hypothetical protein
MSNIPNRESDSGPSVRSQYETKCQECGFWVPAFLDRDDIGVILVPKKHCCAENQHIFDLPKRKPVKQQKLVKQKEKQKNA